MTKRARIIILLASAALVCVMALSVFAVAAEAGHACTGAHCPICVGMEFCARVVRALSGFVPLLCVTAAALKLVLSRAAPVWKSISSTPVQLMVKMIS